MLEKEVTVKKKWIRLYLCKSAYTSRPCLIAFHFIVFYRYCTFSKLRICGKLVYGTIFFFSPAAFAYFMFLCHILVMPQIFETFIIIIVFIIVICDQLSVALLLWLSLRFYESCSNKTMNLKLRVFWLLHQLVFPHPFPSPSASVLPKTRYWN